MSISALPTLDRTSPSFKSNVDDFFSTDLPNFVDEANALASAVDANATSAASSASEAATSENNAASSAISAATSATNAADSALGNSAISTSPLTVGYGTKSLTIQTDKTFVAGMVVKIAETANPTANWMIGTVTSYNSATGALEVMVDTKLGSATASAWTISLTPPIADLVVGAIGAAPDTISTNTVLTSESSGYQVVSSGPVEVTLPDATTLNNGAMLFMIQNDSNSNSDAMLFDSDGVYFGNVPRNHTLILSLEDNSTTAGIWRKSSTTSHWANVLAIIDTLVANSANSTYIDIARLSDTKAILCYSDGGNSNRGTAVVLDSSSGIIAPGTPVVFETGITTYISVDALSETQAIVCYRDQSNSYRGTAVVLDISGTTVAPAVPVVFHTSSTFDFSVAALNATTAIVGYAVSASNGYAKVLTISGSSIAYGTAYNFTITADAYDISVAKLSETQALVCYRDQNNYSYAQVADIAGYSITYGYAAEFEAGTAYDISVAALSGTTAVVCYRDSEAGNGKIRVLTISGSTVYPGYQDVFDDAPAYNNSVEILSANQVIVCYSNNDISDVGKALIIDVFDDIEFGKPIEFEKSGTNYVNVAALTDKQMIVCYSDIDNGGYATAALLNKGV